MWATEWGREPSDAIPPAGGPSQLAIADVRRVKALLWSEHCIECAIPECYQVCPLYVSRQDGRCARFHHGIYPDRRFSGLYPFGADIRFRRWGRLEATLPVGAATPRRMRQLARLGYAGDRALTPIIATLETIDPAHRTKARRKVGGAYEITRDAVLSQAIRAHGTPEAMDDFVVEVTNAEASAVRLIIEVDADRLLVWVALLLEPGHNFHRVPAECVLGPFPDGMSPRRILVYPENDAEVRLIFTWLDFVAYAKSRSRSKGEIASGTSIDAKASGEPAAMPAPASKVKVVAWDLDNTLWEGVLIEDGADGISLRRGVTATIEELDRRGILNVVLSKNDDEQAWAIVEALGLSDYFVARAINWHPKSQNLRALAEQLNLNVDSFALIDDSAFERAEVEGQLPQVRTYDQDAIDAVLSRPEFDVPITTESRQRRLSYLAEGQRLAYAKSAGVGYMEFLEACDMQVEVFEPSDEDEKTRCLELIQRSNQLNLSGYRYTKEEFDGLLGSPSTLCFAWRCHDRFGDYGIVGFCSVTLEARAEPIVRDLVISCRVAKKKVENGLFGWLAAGLLERGFETLRAAYKPTTRNHVLLDALVEAGFDDPDRGDETLRILRLPLAGEVPDHRIVTVHAVDLPASAWGHHKPLEG